jgi:hypothetical protein
MSSLEANSFSSTPVSPSPGQRRRRRDKATAVLSPNQSITFTAESLTFECVISMLDELLGKAKKAHASGMRLKTFLLVLEDQNLDAKER